MKQNIYTLTAITKEQKKLNWLKRSLTKNEKYAIIKKELKRKDKEQRKFL
jgi:hypothetical protein